MIDSLVQKPGSVSLSPSICAGMEGRREKGREIRCLPEHQLEENSALASLQEERLADNSC